MMATRMPPNVMRQPAMIGEAMRHVRSILRMPACQASMTQAGRCTTCHHGLAHAHQASAYMARPNQALGVNRVPMMFAILPQAIREVSKP